MAKVQTSTTSVADAAAKYAGQESATGISALSQASSGVSLPGQNGLSVHFAGTKIAENVAKVGSSSSAVAERVGADGERVSYVMQNASSSKEFTFSIDGASRVEKTPSGGLLAYDSAGRASAYLPAPWARDAAGKAIQTHYEVSGSTVTQVINTPSTGVSYPVTADPHVKWVHWYQPEVLFSFDETKRVRNPEVLLTMTGAICAAVAAETLGAGCAGFAAESGAIAAVASNAYGDHKCLALRYGIAPWEVDCNSGK